MQIPLGNPAAPYLTDHLASSRSAHSGIASPSRPVHVGGEHAARNPPSIPSPARLPAPFFTRPAGPRIAENRSPRGSQAGQRRGSACHHGESTQLARWSAPLREAVLQVEQSPRRRPFAQADVFVPVVPAP